MTARRNKIKKFFIFGAGALLCLFAVRVFASATLGTIDPHNAGHYLAKIYDSSLGDPEINFGKFTTESSHNITVSSSGLRGYAWGELAGWIVTNCADTTSGCSSSNGNFKVAVASDGTLSGYAWGENTGWINFGPFSNSSTPQVKIKSDGVFAGTTGNAGYAWSQNFGWIIFDCSDPDSCVDTDYIPGGGTSHGGGGGGGGGSGTDLCPNVAGAQATIPDGLVIDAHGDCIAPEQCTELSGDLQQPLDVMVIIDRSGSMGDSVSPGVTKMTQAKNAAVAFINNLIPGLDEVGYVSFSNSASLSNGLTTNFNSVITSIQATTANGNTNIGAAETVAWNELSAHGRAGVKHVIVLLTDGDATVSDVHGVSPDQYAVNQSTTAKAGGAVIYTIGLGTDVNASLLSSIATDARNYYYSPTGTDLSNIYSQIAAIECTAAPANITGTVYYDANGNGVRDVTESGLPDSVVYLVSQDGAQPTRQVTTAVDGTFSFANVPTDQYQVCNTPPAGMNQTFPISPNCYNISVFQGINNTGILFLASGSIPPPDFCTAHPTDPSCTTPPPDFCTAHPTDPSCITAPPPANPTCATDPSLCPPQLQSCLTNPELCNPPPSINPPPEGPPAGPGGPAIPPGGGGGVGGFISNILNGGNFYQDLGQIPLLLSGLRNFIARHFTIFAAAGLSGLLSFLLTEFSRIWEWLLWLFGFSRRRKKWGTVYDSVTKYPLDPAYVVATDTAGNTVAESITDLDGRYGFVLSPGSYKISASKTHYKFPSERLKQLPVDEVYSDLYFGDTIEITDKDQVISKNIPMDPVDFDWNEAEKRRTRLGHYSRQIRARKFFGFLFYLGFAITFISFISTFSPWHFAILCCYVILLFAKPFSNFGGSSLTSRTTGQPIPFAIVTVYAALDNRKLIKRVTSPEGKFFALVPNGIYYITVETKNDDGSYTLALTTENFKVRGGVVIRHIKI
jgi:Mg-chelatase subunit ChlD